MESVIENGLGPSKCTGVLRLSQGEMLDVYRVSDGAMVAQLCRILDESARGTESLSMGLRDTSAGVSIQLDDFVTNKLHVS
jgi:hypothetical protein